MLWSSSGNERTMTMYLQMKFVRRSQHMIILVTTPSSPRLDLSLTRLAISSRVSYKIELYRLFEVIPAFVLSKFLLIPEKKVTDNVYSDPRSRT